MRVLVCGGREYGATPSERAAVVTVLAALRGDVTVVHGAAPGADSEAGQAAEILGLRVEKYPADWATHGKAAGPLRNQQMLDTGIDLVIAFPGGRGTADMKGRARLAGVVVLEVT